MNKNYLFIIIGGAISFYANATEKQNVFLLVAGIVILMFGIYKLQATIPSRKKNETYIKSEKIDNEEE